MTDSDQEREIIRKTTKEVLQAMDIDIQASEEKIESSEDGGEIFTINLKFANPSILIGQSGSNLQALQYIIKLLAYQRIRALDLKNKDKDTSKRKMIRINLDINDYKKQRENSLRELARDITKQALYSGNSIALRPMSSYERRIIHMEIAKHPKLSTESLGEEPFRKIIIKVKEN